MCLPQKLVTPGQRAYLHAFDDYVAGDRAARSRMQCALLSVAADADIEPAQAVQPERDPLERLAQTLLVLS